MSGGSLKKLGTESNGISGTVCWANSTGLSLTTRAERRVFISASNVERLLRLKEFFSLNQHQLSRSSEEFVARTIPAFGCNPIDDFVGIHNVAGLTVDAVREI